MGRNPRRLIAPYPSGENRRCPSASVGPAKRTAMRRTAPSVGRTTPATRTASAARTSWTWTSSSRWHKTPPYKNLNCFFHQHYYNTLFSRNLSTNRRNPVVEDILFKKQPLTLFGIFAKPFLPRNGFRTLCRVLGSSYYSDGLSATLGQDVRARSS